MTNNNSNGLKEEQEIVMKLELELTQKEILYPITYPTIDVAVIDFDTNEVLLGKKPDHKGYVFVGGFVDPSDETLEDACMRELGEEVCGIKTTDIFTYIRSKKVGDKRYPKRDETIHTSLFAVEYVRGEPKPKKHLGVTEFDDVCFFEISKKSLKYVNKSHKELFKSLIEWMEV